MEFTKNKNSISLPEVMILVAVLIAGLFFIRYMYKSAEENNHNNALMLGKSIVATLPVDKIASLSVSIADTASADYQALKRIFSNLVKETENARFVYLFTRSESKYFFMVDSESENSEDYSPPGQEYNEIAETDKIPFLTGKSIVTPPLTDRWGYWVSILVPVKEKTTGKVIAVFGIDISAKSWQTIIWREIAESSFLVLCMILLTIFMLRSVSKNRHLKKEIAERQATEKLLTESEERYRLIYENASIGIYQTTPDGQILLSNPALLKILGYKSFDELKLRNIEKGQFDPTYSRAEFKKKIEETGEIHGLENKWVRQDGEFVYIRENARVMRDRNGNTLFYHGTIEDITERVLAEKALRKSELRFRQITEQSREVVWETDENGLYTYVSPLSTSVLGYTPDQLIGKMHFYDVHPEQTREDFRKAALEVFSRKESFHDYVNEVVSGSGKMIWVTTNGTPILDENGNLLGYRGADSDITERIVRENLLKKLTLAVEQSPVSIVITNPDGEIEYGNPKACYTTGYTAEELIGKNPRVLKSGLTPSGVYKELWETILAGKLWQGEFINQTKDGKIYTEAASISPIFDDEGNIINFLAVKEDITNVKLLIAELQLAKEKAESSDLLKSAFIKNISHEIRTPLNGIVGMSEQIIKASVSQENKEVLLNLIKQSSKRLLSTVTNYLDISMIVSGNMIIQIETFGLNSILREITSETEPECQEKGIALLLNVPHDTEHIKLETDPEIFRKIIIHLLDNAVKFTEQGGVSLSYKLESNKLIINIIDTGIGIDQAFLPSIFDTFTQADNSDSRAYEGSGLGLALSYRMAQLLNGNITVKSEKGQGSEFFLTFNADEILAES